MVILLAFDHQKPNAPDQKRAATMAFSDFLRSRLLYLDVRHEVSRIKGIRQWQKLINL
jgi:hypothetical protein